MHFSFEMKERVKKTLTQFLHAIPQIHHLGSKHLVQTKLITNQLTTENYFENISLYPKSDPIELAIKTNKIVNKEKD